MKSDWLSMLQSARQNQTDEIPEGFKRFSEIMEEAKMGRTAVRERLTKLIKSGKVETRVFLTRDIGGRLNRVPFYKLK